MAHIIFDNHAWTTFSFAQAKVRCERCRHVWTTPDTEDTDVWARCPECEGETIRVLEPGPTSVRQPGR